MFTPFHGGDGGSNPPGDANLFSIVPEGDWNGRGALTSRKKSATPGSATAPSPAAMAVAMDGRRLRRSNPPGDAIFFRCGVPGPDFDLSYPPVASVMKKPRSGLESPIPWCKE